MQLKLLLGFAALALAVSEAAAAGPAPNPPNWGQRQAVTFVWVNGQPVGEKLWGPFVFEVGQALRPGKNEIRVRVANLINNSYGDIQESGLLGPVTVQTAAAGK